MRLYCTNDGCFVEHRDRFYSIKDASWDALITRDDLDAHLTAVVQGSIALAQNPLLNPGMLRAPIGRQEVWAAGVTYFRSRDARMEESKSAGGGNFYDRVYSAERP